jgi:hypothetical protein
LGRDTWDNCNFIWEETLGRIVTSFGKRHLGELRYIKVKFSLEQAMKAQRGRRGIALLFL